MEQHDGGSGDNRARTTTGDRRTAMRLLNRQSQGLVAVYETDPDSPTDTPSSLVFESRVKCTRVTPAPLEWQRLSDDELVALQRKGA